jgi:hypothetical protein
MTGLAPFSGSLASNGRVLFPVGVVKYIIVDLNIPLASTGVNASKVGLLTHIKTERNIDTM